MVFRRGAAVGACGFLVLALKALLFTSYRGRLSQSLASIDMAITAGRGMQCRNGVLAMGGKAPIRFLFRNSPSCVSFFDNRVNRRCVCHSQGRVSMRSVISYSFGFSV